MSVLLFALLLSGACVAVEVSPAPHETDRSFLQDRVDSLEQMLHAQHVLVSQQQGLLHHQHEELARLGQLVQQQSAELSRQGVMLRHQQEELSVQRGVNHAQDERLTRQADLLSDQAARLASQDALLRQQGAALSLSLQGVPEDSGLHSHDSLHGEALTRSGRDATEQRLSQASSSTSSRRSARADDTNPLEPVVSQLSQQVTAMSADFQTLKTSTAQYDSDIRDARTSTFVHWGGSQCRGSSQLVYTGLVGGSHGRDDGAAANYLCLSLDPVPAHHSGHSTDRAALLYGAEYQTHDANHNKDPVCAVCRAAFSTTVMVPGTNVCPAGWHSQYTGYLMAGAPDIAGSSEYICVDRGLESRDASSTNQNGRMLFFTRTVCGSLPCDPYHNSTLVACAVCSD